MLAGNLAYKSEEKKIKASIFFRLQCIMHTVYIYHACTFSDGRKPENPHLALLLGCVST